MGTHAERSHGPEARRSGAPEAAAHATAGGGAALRPPPSGINWLDSASADGPAAAPARQQPSGGVVQRQTVAALLPGLAVPAHPDAAQGIKEFDADEPPPHADQARNTFRAGKYVLGQNTRFGPGGKALVMYYIAYDTLAHKNMYIVGPESFWVFVMLHAGGAQPRPGALNSDALAKDDAPDATGLKAAPDAYRGLDLYYIPVRLPGGGQRGIRFKLSIYLMTPMVRSAEGGPLLVLYYEAYNEEMQRYEYIVGPDSLDVFSSKEGGFYGIAMMSYPFMRGAYPAAYQIESARYVQGAMRSDLELAERGTEAWKAAGKDPGWWLQLVMNYASVATPVRTTPELTVIRGGGGGARVSTGVGGVGGVGAAAPAVVGPGGAATALARPLEQPMLAAAPAARPLVGLATNPNPMPAAPLVSPAVAMATNVAISGLGSQAAMTAATSPATNPNPKPKQRPPFVLRLPLEKAPHFVRYQSWLTVLQSDPNYQRGNPGQLDIWHQKLRLGGSDGIPSCVYERGHALGFTGAAGERRVRVPNWSRMRSTSMEVDHIIELQLTPSAMRSDFNSLANMELLDETSNGNSGKQIQLNVAAERARQVAFDPTAANRVLRFDAVTLEGGTPGERWSVDEIRAGEQLDAYEQHDGP